MLKTAKKGKNGNFADVFLACMICEHILSKQKLPHLVSLIRKKTVWFDTTIVIFRHFQLKLTELLKIQGKSLYMFAKKITLYIGKLTQLSG